MKEDQLYLPLAIWLGYFFQYALDKKKSFYWAWDRFMIVVRRQKKKKIFLILEIQLKKAPFLIQKHVDITNIPPSVLINSLLFLHDHYESSPMLSRNREHSTHFLSFRSFLDMLKTHDIKTKQWYGDVGVNRLLVAYLMNTLDSYHVPIKKPAKKLYTLSELLVN